MHTPGPWRIVTPKEADETGRYAGDIVGPDGETLAYTYGDRPNDDTLIAAAPDLLAALESLLTRCEGYLADAPDGEEWIALADAAIARAKGA